MRRVLAISLAILVVTLAARGVMAQDSQQDGNDLLLKILKERNILSSEEYQEIKGQLAQQQTDEQLTALDRSVADYLAKSGDMAGGQTSYVQNQGVTFSSGDGMWSVYFGGLFQTQYRYNTVDTSGTPPSGGFGVPENRLDFGGTIFDPALQFYVQAQANGTFALLDAYLDWEICDYASLRVGQFKTPMGRSHMVDQSDRAFGHLTYVPGLFMAPVNATVNGATGATTIAAGAGRDTGIMFHNVADLDDNPNGMKLEWMLGLWNGSTVTVTNAPVAGLNGTFGNQATETQLMWGGRLGFYPMGMIDYVEGDWEGSSDVKFGIAGSFLTEQISFVAGADNPEATQFGIDGVLTWNGLYFTVEYFSRKLDPQNDVPDWTDTAFYVQGGYFVMPGEVEVLARFGSVKYENDNKETEIGFGAAYYFNGHEWKIVGEVGLYKLEPDAAGAEDVKGTTILITLQADW